MCRSSGQRTRKPTQHQPMGAASRNKSICAASLHIPQGPHPRPGNNFDQVRGASKTNRIFIVTFLFVDSNIIFQAGKENSLRSLVLPSFIDIECTLMSKRTP